MQDYSAELFMLLQTLRKMRGAGFSVDTDTLEKIRDELTSIEGSGFDIATHSLIKLAGSGFDSDLHSLRAIAGNISLIPYAGLYPFGDGRHGSLTVSTSNCISGVYILPHLGPDGVWMFDDLTILTGVELKPTCNIICVKGTLTISGTGKITANAIDINGFGGGGGAGGMIESTTDINPVKYPGTSLYGGVGGSAKSLNGMYSMKEVVPAIPGYPFDRWGFPTMCPLHGPNVKVANTNAHKGSDGGGKYGGTASGSIGGGGGSFGGGGGAGACGGMTGYAAAGGNSTFNPSLDFDLLSGGADNRKLFFLQWLSKWFGGGGGAPSSSYSGGGGGGGVVVLAKTVSTTTPTIEAKGYGSNFGGGGGVIYVITETSVLSTNMSVAGGTSGGTGVIRIETI